ncbi:MAG: hypothetical protein PHQ28_12865, partial [Mycobacterium sp.]|nr:hypothetical protein [Mycobacterium sp.]
DLDTSTTLTNVAGAAFYIEDAGTYAWTYTCRCDIDNTPGIKLAFTVPADATVSGQGVLFDPATMVADAQDDINAVHATRLVLVPASGGIVLQASGQVVAGGTAGTAQLQAAQETSDAATIHLYATGAQFMVTKVHD